MLSLLFERLSAKLTGVEIDLHILKKPDQMKKLVGKFARVSTKKVKQAFGLSLRNLFEQLAWRTSPAAVRA